MKIALITIPIYEIFEGFKDDKENGVFAYGGKLNIRPSYQREMVYNELLQKEVIKTIFDNYPINIMYWAKTGDDTYSLMDGQQRTFSICRYLAGEFSVDSRYYKDLNEEEKKKILNYKIMIYVCDGTSDEQIEWFTRINMPGEKLSEQELRNAIFTGRWLNEAKEYFCKNGCKAHQIANKYIAGSAIRQDYLQTALSWMAHREQIKIEDYMAKHQYDTECNELCSYFETVIEWVEKIFPKKFYRPIMKGQPWGEFYNDYHNMEFDPFEIEKRVKTLLLDNEIENYKGIYAYIFSNSEASLNLRSFSRSDIKKKYEKQYGICSVCKKQLEYETAVSKHIIPWKDGGKTKLDNLMLICPKCHENITIKYN